MSAIPRVQGIPAPTSTHRAASPVWPFHQFLIWAGWVAGLAVWRVREFESRHVIRPIVAAGFVGAVGSMVTITFYAFAGLL